MTASPTGVIEPSADPSAEPSSQPSSPPAPSLEPGPSPVPAPLRWPPSAPTYRDQVIPRAALERRLAALARRFHLPGISVTIRWPDGRVWTGTAGRTDASTRTPMTADTAFALASISKTYTAATILRLVEDGTLVLDDRAARYLPDLHLDRRITIRMLLAHTSGLPDVFLNPAIDGPLQKRPDATWTLARTLRYLRKPLFPPGTAYAYSNTNYLLLGRIAEIADGRPLAIQIRARFLDPLGLTETWSQVAEKPLTPTSRGHRMLGSGARRTARPVPDGGAVMPFRSVITAVGGAGGIAATSRDAARWMESLVLGNVLEADTRLLLIGGWGSTTGGGPLPAIGYGLGVQRVELGHQVALGHSGRLLGYRSVVRVLPSLGVTIAVLTNQGTVDPSLVAASLLQLVTPRPNVCAPCPEIL